MVKEQVKEYEYQVDGFTRAGGVQQSRVKYKEYQQYQQIKIIVTALGRQRSHSDIE